MDEDSQDLVRVAAEGGVAGFLKTVAPSIVEAGGWAGDLIRRHRVKSAVKTLQLAESWLQEAGIEPEKIPLSVLVPWFEYSTLGPEAEDESADAQAMRQHWAALLANAAAGDLGADVLPGFPHILAELTPVEAEMLDWVIRSLDSNIKGFSEAFAGVSRQEMHVNNLERLRLVVREYPYPEMQKVIVSGTKHRDAWGTISPSALALAFWEACTPPSGSPPAA